MKRGGDKLHLEGNRLLCRHHLAAQRCRSGLRSRGHDPLAIWKKMTSNLDEGLVRALGELTIHLEELRQGRNGVFWKGGFEGRDVLFERCLREGAIFRESAQLVGKGFLGLGQYWARPFLRHQTDATAKVDPSRHEFDLGWGRSCDDGGGGGLVNSAVLRTCHWAGPCAPC